MADGVGRRFIVVVLRLDSSRTVLRGAIDRPIDRSTDRDDSLKRGLLEVDIDLLEAGWSAA
jgi:hypothetical protein